MMKKRVVWFLGFGVLVVVAVVILWPSAPAPELPAEIPVYQPSFTPVVDREDFFVESDGLRLEAALLIPQGGREPKPAVVFLAGSGLDHFDDYAPGFLESYVEGVFLPNDIAVLYFNKRGVGASEGNSRRNDFQGRADDAYAAVQALQAHPAVDPGRIGVIGYSQGGWVTSLVASQHDDVAFFISLAGPTTTVEEQIEHTARSFYRCQGLEGDALERKVRGQLRQVRVGATLGRVIPVGEIGFMAGILGYDPREALKAVSTPGLLVFGETDGLVPPSENLARLNEIFPEGLPENLSVVTMSNATHAFRVDETGCAPWPDYLTLPYSVELVAALTSWLQTEGFAVP
ncbi:MAG: alpha/beta hydrolase family protein [Anaerolineae bacterium]